MAEMDSERDAIDEVIQILYVASNNVSDELKARNNVW